MEGSDGCVGERMQSAMLGRVLGEAAEACASRALCGRRGRSWPYRSLVFEYFNPIALYIPLGVEFAVVVAEIRKILLSGLTQKNWVRSASSVPADDIHRAVAQLPPWPTRTATRGAQWTKEARRGRVSHVSIPIVQHRADSHPPDQPSRSHSSNNLTKAATQAENDRPTGAQEMSIILR